MTERQVALDALGRRDKILRGDGLRRRALPARAHVGGRVDEVLGRLGHAADASRAYVFRNHREPTARLLMTQCAEWMAAGIEPTIDPDNHDLPYARRLHPVAAGSCPPAR